MTDTPHDFSKGTGTVGVVGHPTWKLTCGECGWSQIIATEGSPLVVQCPACGWDEIEPIKEGTFATFVCAKHGRVTCIVTDANSHPDDYMDSYCPHCRVVAGQYFGPNR